MQNPYTHSSGPAPASPEQQRIADYELAIGPNREYYLPKFEEFDQGGSTLGWNWPAFFVTSPWFLFRKMWLPGLLNLAYPWILLIVLSIAFAATRPSITVMVVVSLLLLVAPWVLLPMYANSLYWRHVRKLIDNLPRTIADQPDKRAARIERNGGTGVGPMIGVIAGGGFFVIMILGILAAIAIPAYQDYTIRAQITEGLNLASGPKAAVAEYFAQNESWPEHSDAAGLGPITGKYVESVVVENGSVVIVYGGTSNSNITGKTLILMPGTNATGDVVWACASIAPEGVVEYAPSRYGTDLPLKYLPQKCREGPPIPGE